jgi:hypothetical protein
MRIEFCSGCGAPLEARWSKIVIECRYCGSENAPGDMGDPVPSSIPDDGRTRLAVVGRTYLVQGLLGTGDSSHVYRGRWVRRLGELVVIKVERCSEDRDLLRREWSFLERLMASPAQGAEHFSGRLPEPIAMSPVKMNGEERLVSVFGWKSGFHHTLSDVMDVHGDGIAARCAVWVFKRLLEILGWVHRSGVVHGAVIPPHVLIHPRDHGAMLVGWSVSTAWSPSVTERIPAVSRAYKDWYPSGDREGTPALDISMAARCVLRAAGASGFADGGKLPPALAGLLISAAGGKYDDAWALLDLVTRESLESIGPPAYSPLDMPGWMVSESTWR